MSSKFIITCFLFLALLTALFFLHSRENSIDINAKGPDGLPIIFWLVKQRNVKAIQQYIEAGGDIEAKGFAQSTPIITAGTTDSWIVAKFLAEQGANLRAVDTFGFNLPALAKESTVGTATEQYAALQKLKGRLEEEGLMQRIYTPKEVETMLENKEWPPA